MPTAATRRSGPDLCPGVRSVWSAADGGLARVRLPGGRLSVRQLRVLADAADELGNGILELTVRANVQVRGLRPSGEHDLAARLRAEGLLPSDTHDRVRNILASPLSGLPGRGDITDLIAALDEGLCERPELAELPGRFLFALDDGSLDVCGLGADATALATEECFALVLGGVAVDRWVRRVDVIPALLAAAEGFLAERAAQSSSAWRLHELADGPSRVRARVEATVPMSPSGPPLPAGALGSPMITVGMVALADGRFVAVVPVPDGRLTSATARALAAAAASEQCLRVTPWRCLVLPGLTESAARAALALTSEHPGAIATTSSDATRGEVR